MTAHPARAPQPERGGSGREGLDYEQLYDFRFRRVSQAARVGVWREIAAQVDGWLGRPQRVLDVAAGHGEFITAIDAEEKWAIDTVDFLGPRSDIRMIVGDARHVDLPSSYFDGVFVSNFLEHLDHADEIAALLHRLRGAMSPGGRIAVLGPNFRFCSREYFDFADHKVALTHRSVEEHLHAAGFAVDRVVAQFLPYSFRGRLPTNPALVRAYMRFPPAWKVLGKQYLLLASNPEH
jgi:ubiquinone/menaquinone biosynthesis C-methylase UbiE